MSYEESSETASGGGGRRPRQGVGGSPVGSTLSIVLAVVAVIAGFLILRNITDDGGSDDGSSGAPVATDATETTLGDLVGTTTTAVTATTTPFVTEGATVVVANANTVGGSAGKMTQALQAAGFTMGDPVNATIEIKRSRVQYDESVASAEAVAKSVAQVLGGVKTQPMPSPPPVEGEDIGDASVLLLLGNAQAGKTLEQLSGGVPATGTAPAPAGSESATTAGG
jgi:hypothetical protein